MDHEGQPCRAALRRTYDGLVKLKLDNRHLETTIDRELDKRVETAVRQAIDSASAKAVATALEMMQRKVSEHIASEYEIDVDVRVRRKNGPQ